MHKNFWIILLILTTLLSACSKNPTIYDAQALPEGVQRVLEEFDAKLESAQLAENSPDSEVFGESVTFWCVVYSTDWGPDRVVIPISSVGTYLGMQYEDPTQGFFEDIGCTNYTDFGD